MFEASRAYCYYELFCNCGAPLALFHPLAKQSCWFRVSSVILAILRRRLIEVKTLHFQYLDTLDPSVLLRVSWTRASFLSARVASTAFSA